jgi:phage tail-like protein
MALTQDTRLGMAMRFRVVVDDINLGGWASCTGLAVDFRNMLVLEGANYEYKPILPERVEYRPIVLRRAMTQQDSAAVQQWLSKVVAKWYNASSPSDYSARTARITLLDSQGSEVASWSLRSVYPMAWTGPDLDAAGRQVAVETLQLMHEGFL